MHCLNKGYCGRDALLSTRGGVNEGAPPSNLYAGVQRVDPWQAGSRWALEGPTQPDRATPRRTPTKESRHGTLRPATFFNCEVLTWPGRICRRQLHPAKSAINKTHPARS